MLVLSRWFLHFAKKKTTIFDVRRFTSLNNFYVFGSQNKTRLLRFGCVAHIKIAIDDVTTRLSALKEQNFKILHYIVIWWVGRRGSNEEAGQNYITADLQPSYLIFDCSLVLLRGRYFFLMRHESCSLTSLCKPIRELGNNNFFLNDLFSTVIS